MNKKLRGLALGLVLATASLGVSSPARATNEDAWLAYYEHIMRAGAWEAVAMAALALNSQREANRASNYAQFHRNQAAAARALVSLG